MKLISKISKCILITVCFITFMVASLPLKVFAEEKTERLVNIKEPHDIAVSIEWENDQPDVYLVAPDGTKYLPDEEREDTDITKGTGYIYYYIEMAQAGQWNIVYDKKNNESLDIEVSDINPLLSIEDLTVSNITEKDATVTFSAEFGEQRTYYKYEIYITADSDPASRGEKVYNGGAYTGNQVSHTINLSKYSTSSNFRVFVYAYVAINGVDISDSLYSDTFSYVNPKMKELSTPVSLVIEPDATTVYVNWEPAYNTTYMPAFFSYSDSQSIPSEPDYFIEINGRNTSTYEYNYGLAEGIKVNFSEKPSGGVYCTPKEFIVSIKNLPSVTFEENTDSTNKESILMNYEGFMSKTSATVDINGEEDAVTFDGAGSLRVVLNEGENTISVSFEYAPDVYVVYKKEVFRDSTPPRIYMSQDYRNVVTNEDKYTVSGIVSEASKFTIGGEDVALLPDGSFSHTLSLSKGVNTFEAIATDVVGNSALYTISVTKGGSSLMPFDVSGKGGFLGSIKTFLPGIIAGVIALLLIVWALISWRKDRKMSPINSVMVLMIVLDVLCVAASVCGYFMWKQQSDINMSGEFINAVTNSITDAYQMLKLEGFFRALFLAGIVGFIIFTVSAILIGLRKKHKKAE